MAHNCRVPARSNENPWICPVCKSPWTITTKRKAAKSKNENIRINGRRPLFFGK